MVSLPYRKNKTKELVNRKIK